MDVETRELYAEAVLGGDAHDFFGSELGQYVLERSKEESDKALEELKHVDASEPKNVIELQIKVLIAEKAVKWLNDIMIAGRQAMDILEEGE